MTEKGEYPITESLMGIYDVAVGFSEKEKISHREAFETLLKYLEVTERLEEKEGELKKLEQEIQERQINLVILESMLRGIKHE